jgi:hypothetical protein
VCEHYPVDEAALTPGAMVRVVGSSKPFKANDLGHSEWSVLMTKACTKDDSER